MTLTHQSHTDIDHARAVEARIARGTSLINRAWLQLAKDIHEFLEHEMWRTLGYETAEDWMASPEIDLQRRHAYGLREVWRTLVIDRQVDPDLLGTAEVTKVQAVLPAIKSGKVETDEALADAEALSRSDLKEKYGRGKSKVLDAEAEPEKAMCPVCKSWVDAARLREAA